MSTKKAFVTLVALLEQNKDKKVSSILEQVRELTQAKKNVSTVRKNAAGKITHIFCYYHKQWEDIKIAEYGSKASSATGLNTMCKVGVNKWTKQQSVAKNAKTDLLDEVATGKVKPEDIKKRLDEIEVNRNKIDMKDAPAGTKE